MLKVKIATPSEKIYDGELAAITLQTTNGVITVLPNHVPFITTIENGYVKYNENKIIMKKGAVILDNNGNLEILGY
ncbi:hypothetical protein RZE82_07470 [Mollicutes bacterium LVI A0039]|nr:hypothetical protein RZE82_07470 [Mollicutes bacterium LVI A0039]